MKHSILAFGVAAISALALACGEQAASPAAPSAVASDRAAAAADGSTLKATAPAPQLPANASTADSLTPNLVVANATLKHLGDVTIVGALQYRFVVETAGGASVINAVTGAGAALTGSRVAANVLQTETSYRWRARAERDGAFGPWSGYWTFTTPKPAPVAAPAPAPAPKGGPWPTTPDAIVGYVAAKYPQYLKATSSLHDREVNMAYIRDRMIEAGICGGFDLAWNLKRGVGPRSTDALLWRDGGRDRVIDIAAGFDEYRSALRLHWIEVEGPPGYDRYLPRPACQ